MIDLVKACDEMQRQGVHPTTLTLHESALAQFEPERDGAGQAVVLAGPYELVVELDATCPPNMAYLGGSVR